MRVTKPGGVIAFTLRPDVYRQNGFREKQEELAAKGKWELVEVTDEFRGMPKGEPDVFFQALGVQSNRLMSDRAFETAAALDYDDERLRFSWDDLPAASAHLPGTGGVLRTRIEDFEVEEIPSYLPSGAGVHAYAFVEKRGLTTRDVVDAIVGAGVARGSVGFAGQKDKYAVARQWISVPFEHEAALKALDDVEGVRLLETSVHRNKLGLGHLKGNRFSVRVREPSDDWRPVAEGVLVAPESVLARPTTSGRSGSELSTRTLRTGCSLSGARGCVSTAGCSASTSPRCSRTCSTNC